MIRPRGGIGIAAASLLALLAGCGEPVPTELEKCYREASLEAQRRPDGAFHEQEFRAACREACQQSGQCPDGPEVPSTGGRRGVDGTL